VWVNASNLNPIRADVYYKVGRFFEDQNEWDVSIPLFARGIQLAPTVDAYPMALGRVLKYRANASRPEPASRFSDQTRLQDVLALDVQQMAGLNRLDFLYAAQTMLLHARDLNPLYTEHTLNLARFYVPETPIDSDAKVKLAELASRYYAQAIRLSPGNVLLWNEWAVLDLDRQDVDAALAKLEESLRRDPRYGPTYVDLGKAYAAQKDLERAAQAYRQALALQPDLAEAHSRLAFTYYQQGQLVQAAQAYSRYIELSPQASNVWEAHKNLALIYKRMGDLGKAISEAQLAAHLAPSEAQPQLDEMVKQWQTQMSTSQPPVSLASP
jgi:tetratricopeptide (TPR) repeat protein